MPQAEKHFITVRLPLSSIIADPRVRAAFERAERDRGGQAGVLADRPRPKLPNCAALVLEAADAA